MKKNDDTYDFEYWPSEDNTFASPIRLSYDKQDTTLDEFCQMCRAFAFALGYDKNAIDNYFRVEGE